MVPVSSGWRSYQLNRKQSRYISLALLAGLLHWPHWCSAGTNTQAVGLCRLSLHCLHRYHVDTRAYPGFHKKHRIAWRRIIQALLDLCLPYLQQCSECAQALHDFTLQYRVWTYNPISQAVLFSTLPLPCLTSFWPSFSMPPTLRFIKRCNLGGLCWGMLTQPQHSFQFLLYRTISVLYKGSVPEINEHKIKWMKIKTKQEIEKPVLSWKYFFLYSPFTYFFNKLLQKAFLFPFKSQGFSWAQK